MRTTLWRVVPFIIFMVLTLFFWRALSLDPHNLPSVQIGKPLPAFRLPVLIESDQTLFTPLLIRGKTVLLNVWASWCEACKDEQYFLMQLARQGYPIYGINYKDKPEEARQWLEEWGNPYRLIGRDDGKVAIDLGVYGAPETFLVDKDGRIRYRHAGVLNASIWEKEFLPRLKDLEQTT